MWHERTAPKKRIRLGALPLADRIVSAYDTPQFAVFGKCGGI